jgi:hypothetical protein
LLVLTAHRNRLFIVSLVGAFCRYESYDMDSEAPFKVGKRIRITAANAVNVNVTSAGLETLVESVMSWRKQTELEEQARMALEMVLTLSPDVNVRGFGYS